MKIRLQIDKHKKFNKKNYEKHRKKVLRRKIKLNF